MASRAMGWVARPAHHEELQAAHGRRLQAIKKPRQREAPPGSVPPRTNGLLRFRPRVSRTNRHPLLARVGSLSTLT